MEKTELQDTAVARRSTTDAQRAAVEKRLRTIMSDGVARTQEEIIHHFLVNYRRALMSLLPELLGRAEVFELSRMGFWRDKSVKSPRLAASGQPSGQRPLRKKPKRPKQKKVRNESKRKTSKPLDPPKRQRNRRTRSSSDKSVSVWTVSGGLPSLGKRR
jgi:hypothetical protein